MSEVSHNALRSVKRALRWLLLEGKLLSDFHKAVQRKDMSHARRFERRAARAERRLHQFSRELFNLLEQLRVEHLDLNNILFSIQQQLALYESNILKKVSLVAGTLPQLLSKEPLNWNQLEIEVRQAYGMGVQQLVVLFEHLERELEKLIQREQRYQQSGELQRYETQLNQAPFLVLFHRSNNKDHVNSILAMRHALPDYYLGRKIEYAFETDFFWIEHRGKISPFLGHAPHGFIPWKKWMLLHMKHGAGLLLPSWLLSRIGRIRLVVEVKSGWGTDTRALDELITMLKNYRLETTVTFYAFSSWVLSYLKERLPHSFTILISQKGFFSGRILQFPFNRPLETLKRWGLFPRVGKLSFVDSFAFPSKKTEEKIMKQIVHSSILGKWHFAGMVSKKEQLDALIFHGARGAMLWASPQDVLSWLITPVPAGKLVVPLSSAPAVEERDVA